MFGGWAIEAMRCVEGVEDVGEVFFVYADAGVGDTQNHVAVALFERHGEGPALGHGGFGVIAQIVEQ